MEGNKRSDIEAVPRCKPKEEDNATLTEEKAGDVHKTNAGDVLRKAPGIDGDEALKALELEHGEVITIDEETNRRLVRKIDWHIMPLLCIIYGLQYLDSNFPL